MEKLWSFVIQILVATAVIFVQSRQQHSFGIDYDRGIFLLDGQPFRYISGSVHYFRIPVSYWRDRLQRVKAAGLNAVQFYIPWNFHELYEGRYNFNGIHNITYFLDLINELKLFALVRLGPYVCGEWENGGLPWWLIRNYPDIRMRTSDERFKQEVHKWYSVLLPILAQYTRKNGGPILMVQPENEYGSSEQCDRDYTLWLSQTIRHYLGPDVLQYTTDGSSVSYLKCGAIPGVYPTIDFGPTDRKTVDLFFQAQRKYAPKGPLVNSEFYPGWLVVWGQTRQSLPTDKQLIDTGDYMYQCGASFNYYMFHGGSNFGFWNGAETLAPVITSYDYTAPLTEAGDITPKYVAIRNWLAAKADWPNPPAAHLPRNNSKIGYGEIEMRNVVPFGRQLWRLVSTSTRCVQTRYPITFENLNHPFGFVVYHTYLNFGGTNLTIPNLRDRGYVFLDDQPQGIMFNGFKNRSITWITLIDAPLGAQLAILVENQGRLTNPTINDFKGILSNVTLDGRLVDNWTQCGLSNKLLNHIALKQFNGWLHRRSVSPGINGLFIGHFEAHQIADTFFDPTGWRKGQLFINGHNIGRYWPVVGPQITLYVPAPYLKRHNTVMLLELEHSGNCDQQTCSVGFIDYPIFQFRNGSQ